MEFKALEDIAEAGYRHSRTLLDDWVGQRPELAQMLKGVSAV